MQIHAVAPAGIIHPEKFALGGKRLSDFFTADILPTGQLNQQFRNMSGTDEIRLAGLQEAIDGPGDIIWAIRGGFGLTRLLPQLEALQVDPTRPKVIIGYSDITFLQWTMYRRFGWRSIQGHMIQVDFLDDTDDTSIQMLMDLLTQPTVTRYVPDQCILTHTQDVEGIIIGGCLSMVTQMLGTPYIPDLNGKILFLEDVGEPLYKIDGMFSQLRNAGILDQIAGIITGQFTDGNPEFSPDQLHEVLAEYIEARGIPWMDRYPFGHIRNLNPLPIGDYCRWRSDALHFSHE